MSTNPSKWVGDTLRRMGGRASGRPKGRTRGGAMGGGRGGRNGWYCLFGNTISAAIHYNVSPCKCE